MLGEDAKLKGLDQEVVFGQLLDECVEMVPSLPHKVRLHVSLRIIVRQREFHLQ